MGLIFSPAVTTQTWSGEPEAVHLPKTQQPSLSLLGHWSGYLIGSNTFSHSVSRTVVGLQGLDI